MTTKAPLKNDAGCGERPQRYGNNVMGYEPVFGSTGKKWAILTQASLFNLDVRKEQRLNGGRSGKPSLR
jgi:hypothetical protein